MCQSFTYLEAKVGLHDEFYTVAFQAGCQLLPLRDGEACTEMWNRYFITIDWVHIVFSSKIVAHEMRNDLVSVKVKVDPLSRRSALRALQQGSVKLTGCTKKYARGLELQENIPFSSE